MRDSRPRQLSILVGGCAGALLLAAVAAAPGSAQAPAMPTTIQVTSLADSGAGSLREALTMANAAAGGTAIHFTVAGRITLASPLPAVSKQMIIDGTTAPGYAAGGAPVVTVNAAGKSGLVFSVGSDSSQLLGLAVTRASGNGITITAHSITLNANYIGITPAGSAAGNSGAGIYLAPSSAHNVIGLNESGDSGAVSNVISGNGGDGIRLKGSSFNTLVANRIGTNPAGTSAIPNKGNGLAIVQNSSANTIGGTAYIDAATGAVNDPTGDKGTVTPVFVVPPLGNLVSGNAKNGVKIASNSQKNMLNGNFVGTTANGNSRLSNGSNGVWITDANNNTLQGCKFVDNPFIYYNVLSGNGGNGLRISGSDNTLVQANFFGVGANNTSVVANKGDGILVDKAATNTQVGGVIPLGNVSAGNKKNGIEVRGKSSGFTTFNTFGGLLAFKGAAPNKLNGLLVSATGGDILVRTNVMSGNKKNGIKLAGKATGVTVDPNIAGLNTRGDGLLPNGANGVLVTDKAHGNVIGGTLRSVILQNTFSGNDGKGVVINDHAHHNKVFNSYIGTDITGVDALGNGGAGVLIGGRANNNKIGYGKSKTSKLISGNDGAGVVLKAKTRDNKVINNYIGRGKAGECLANGGPAVVDSGSNKVSGNSTCLR